MLHVHGSFPDSSSRAKWYKETHLPPIQCIYLCKNHDYIYTLISHFTIWCSPLSFVSTSKQSNTNKQTKPQNKFSSFSSLSCLVPELHILVSENVGIGESKHQKDAIRYWQQSTSLFILFKLICFPLSHPHRRILVSSFSCSPKSTKTLLV